MKKICAFLCALPLLAAAADLFLAGDSTMCDYDPAVRAPQMGWGTALASLVKPGVKVSNLAVGGKSSKSFLTEKRWDRILSSAKPGDFVIIQFGHNCLPDWYWWFRPWSTCYVSCTRKLG